MIEIEHWLWTETGNKNIDDKNIKKYQYKYSFPQRWEDDSIAYINSIASKIKGIYV